ncbi:NADPH-dependent FMN reductase [Paramicrobacterium agarici]|uniref:NAD(P)H-dependent FMN reductase n=1 Tax=Paramicrobacterium agarici TaxID=630514 RepID=A0A2A9DVL3_9MICO|nr:NAD(P)H-dependent oxidoreductase [Microbacterium agarici]PFG30827.1 NAD(P)H-dependent FMN reductase [Microbacterium agarici]TQO23894.1 NAD(P)H-dependent FMN reductase [Microbacterium agarici]
MTIKNPRSSERPQRFMLVLGSARQGRIALPITLWVHDLLSDYSGVSVDLVDLMEQDLPFMSEPDLSENRAYINAHSRAWSERVSAADSVIFVAPAYGDGLSPVVRNAIDYLGREWKEKPVGLVTYGRDAKRLSRRLGRSLQERGMSVVRPLVALAHARAHVHGVDFDNDPQSSRACERMIDELRVLSGRSDRQMLAEDVA